MMKISKIYALNCISDHTCRVFKNCPYFKSINTNLIRERGINDTVTDYYDVRIYEKKTAFQTLLKEIKLVKRIIEVDVDKYFLMLGVLDKMDICELDQVCVDISRAVGYI